MNSISSVSIGIVIVISLIIQSIFTVKFFSFVNSDFKKNGKYIFYILAPHIFVAFVIVFGAILYNIFDVYNNNYPYLKYNKFEYVVSKSYMTVFFGIILIIKSVVGPILSGITISYSIYIFSERNIFEIFPFMEWAISLLIRSPDENTTLIYSILFMVSTITIHIFSGFLKDPVIEIG